MTEKPEMGILEKGRARTLLSLPLFNAHKIPNRWKGRYVILEEEPNSALTAAVAEKK